MAHRNHHSSSMTGAVVTALKNNQTHTTFRILAGHIPRHATIPATEQILAQWGEQLVGHTKAYVGMDANETFNNVSQHTVGGTANTGRGDLILQWMLQQNLTLPPQQNHLPTYCPYNHQMQPRRLDYIMVRGTTAGAGRVCQCKDRASSSYKCQLRAETTHAKQSRLFPKPPQSESRGGGV